MWHHRDADDHRQDGRMRRGRMSGWAVVGLPPRQVHYVGRCKCDPAVRVPFAAAQSAASRRNARCVGGRGRVWGCGVGGVDHALRIDNWRAISQPSPTDSSSASIAVVKMPLVREFSRHAPCNPARCNSSPAVPRIFAGTACTRYSVPYALHRSSFVLHRRAFLSICVHRASVIRAPGASARNLSVK